MFSARIGKHTLRGLLPAPAVAFTESFQLAEDEVSEHFRAIGSVDGVTGIVVNGHAGEIASLNADERLRVIEIARAALPAKKWVISGIDAARPDAARLELSASASAGADAVLVLPPFDTMARRSLAGKLPAVVSYFEEIATAGVPLIVFQYPVASGCSYSTETLVKLARIEQVVAVKNASWHAEYYSEQYDAVSGLISVLAACDAPELLTMMMKGADGLLLGASSVLTPLWAEYITAIEMADYGTARTVFVERLMPLLDAFFGMTRPRSASFTALTKEAQAQLGVFSSARMRSPELGVDETDKRVIALALRTAAAALTAAAAPLS
jgi:4-hydroxy-tetrahydrodipicolinate synthase